MKTLASLSAVALLLTLAGCDGGSPAVKKVEKNTTQPAAGTIKSPSDELKERMSATDKSTAPTAPAAPKKP